MKAGMILILKITYSCLRIHSCVNLVFENKITDARKAKYQKRNLLLVIVNKRWNDFDFENYIFMPKNS